ncbi:MAG: hypothetical protein ACK2TV_11290 [Anaerolineales bacterium]
MENEEKTTIPFNNLLNNSLAFRLGLVLGKILPRKVGLKIAASIGAYLGNNQDNPTVKAIRANQWVIHDQELTEDELNRIPKIVIGSAAKCLFDYFYFLSRPEKLQQIVHYSPQANIAIDRIRAKKPCVVVCPHLSNFDLVGYTLALHKVEMQILSFPNPSGTYELQNQQREDMGFLVTPMSFSAFHQARNRLRDGGSILTGLDRPLSGDQHDKYQPEFFGYKTNLPVIYVRMAKEANAPVYIMTATSQADNTYLLEGSQPIWMESADDLETEVLNNVNRVLSQAQEYIINYALQWTMFYPIWPQFLGV